MTTLEPTILGVLEECGCSNVFLVGGDVTELSKVFAESFFDCIVCADVLEHLEDPMEALQQFNYCLKPGGLFGFSIPTETSVYKLLRALACLPEPTHKKSYDFHHLLEQIENVFEITKLHRIPPITNLFVCGNAFRR
jgi:2-polyprenyl-3-methyl-5-hydroxy-6-metoxy-1,4-benzoquinol methylase